MTLPKNNICLLIPAYFFTLFISVAIKYLTVNHLVIWCNADSWRKSKVELISSLIAEKMESAVNTLGPRMIRQPNGCRQLKRGYIRQSTHADSPWWMTAIFLSFRAKQSTRSAASPHQKHILDMRRWAKWSLITGGDTGNSPKKPV